MALQGAPSVAAVLTANDNPVSVLLQVCIAAYLAVMFHRVYAVSYWYSIVVAALIGWSFFHLVRLSAFFLS